MRPIDINGRLVGPGHPCWIIAEAGVNHNGSLELARQLVDAAKAAGADAVKFQTFDAEQLAAANAPMAAYQQRNLGTTEPQLSMLRRLALSAADHRQLADYCRARGILFLSTPFDERSADFLAELGMPVFKVPSGEITNEPYLVHVAKLGRPMIVSTGMADLDEVAAALRCIRSAGDPPLVLLQCVSNYPAAVQDANLRAMATMRDTFGVPAGYSDHTLGDLAALTAVALGACVLEKHLTLACTLPGPDHAASMEPDDFRHMVERVRLVEAALGTGRKQPAAAEADTAALARRSLVAAHDLPSGAVLVSSDLAFKRPGTGLRPAMLAQVVGRRLRLPLRQGELVTLDGLQ